MKQEKPETRQTFHVEHGLRDNLKLETSKPETKKRMLILRTDLTGFQRIVE